MKGLFIVALLLALANSVFAQTANAGTVAKRVHKAKIHKPKSSFELLQGKWRSMDDKSNYLVFYNHYRKELSGKKVLDENKFVLADRCPEDKTPPANNNNGKFILQDDLCWSIVSLTKKKLILSFIGSGNTLNYIKIK